MSRIDELQRNGGLSVKIEPDENGHYDKECPVSHCMYHFKVNAEDWKQKFNDESVYCPMCGHNGRSNTYWTTEQIENARNQVRGVVVAEMRNALRSDIESWSKQFKRSGWIKITMNRSSRESVPVILPIEANEVFEQQLTCQHCSARYSVVGSAFFCPCCGNNCVDTTLTNSLKKIRAKVNYVPSIKKMVAAESKDIAEMIGRSIIENCLNDCVVAFQRFCEESYKKVADTGEKIKFNAFQNLEVGGGYWFSKWGENYQCWLTEDEYRRMNLLFNQRHLLSHTEGIVDEKYIQKSEDYTYTAGQRIVVHSKDVLDLIKYIEKIVDVIRKKQSS
jgi:hypothetical protein